MDPNALAYQQWHAQNGLKPGNGIDPSLAKYLTANAAKPQAKGNWIQRNLNTAGQLGGGLGGAAIGTAILPGVGTVAGGLIGAFLGGAGGESAKRASLGQDQNLKESLIQGGIGAGQELAGAGIGGLLAKVAGKGAIAAGEAGAKEAAPGLLGKLGSGLREDVVNPIVKASPFGAAQESAIAKGANKLLPVGSASAKYSAMPKTMEALGNQLDVALAKNTATVPAHDITTVLTNALGDATKFPTTEVAFKKAADTHLSNILQAGAQNGGELSALNIADLRRGLQDVAFKGSTMTPQKEAAQAVWSHLGDVLQQVAPEAKSIIADQGMLFKAAPGLQKAGEKTLGVPLIGVKSRTAERLLQAGKDVTGAGLESAGGLMGKLGGLPTKAATRLAPKGVASAFNPPQAAAQTTPPDQVNGVPIEGATPIDQSSSQDSGAFSPQALQAMAINDIHSTGGKNLDKITQLATLFGPSGKATSAPPKLSKSQQDRSDSIRSALGSLDSAGQNLSSAGGAKGIQGEAGKIPWLGKYLDPQAAAYHNTKIEMATALAKAVTGGSRPASSVIDKYMHSLPDINDNPEYADAKIKKLRNELLAQAKAFGFNDLTNQGG